MYMIMLLQGGTLAMTGCVDWCMGRTTECRPNPNCKAIHDRCIAQGLYKMVCMLTDFNKMQHVYSAMRVLYHLLGVIADMQEVKEVSIRTQLAHDLHHTYALPQAAGWSCPCKKQGKTG